MPSGTNCRLLVEPDKLVSWTEELETKKPIALAETSFSNLRVNQTEYVQIELQSLPTARWPQEHGVTIARCVSHGRRLGPLLWLVTVNWHGVWSGRYFHWRTSHDFSFQYLAFETELQKRSKSKLNSPLNSVQCKLNPSFLTCSQRHCKSRHLCSSDSCERTTNDFVNSRAW